MNQHTFLMVVALATAGCLATSNAFAMFKCTTKAGVVYQDKPCPEAPSSDPITVPGRDGDRAREAQRQLQRTQKQDTERTLEKPKYIVDPRKAEDAADYSEWVERAAKKAESLRRCVNAETQCGVTAIRTAALYLSETQLEGALGAPADKQVIGMESTSHWTVRITDAGRLNSARLIVVWGLCSDDKNYFLSGHGQRACKASIE